MPSLESCRRYRRSDGVAEALPELLPTREKEHLVLNDRTADVKSILVLNIRSSCVGLAAVQLTLLNEIVVRVENLVTDEFVSLSVEGVGTRFRAEVHDAAGELAELRSQVVVLDLEFADGILRRNNDGQVDVADIKRLAVEILGALVPEGTSHLIVAPAKGILADRRSARSALRNGGGRDRDQVKNIAAVQG